MQGLGLCCLGFKLQLSSAHNLKVPSPHTVPRFRVYQALSCGA